MSPENIPPTDYNPSVSPEGGDDSQVLVEHGLPWVDEGEVVSSANLNAKTAPPVHRTSTMEYLDAKKIVIDLSDQDQTTLSMQQLTDLGEAQRRISEVEQVVLGVVDGDERLSRARKELDIAIKEIDPRDKDALKQLENRINSWGRSFRVGNDQLDQYGETQNSIYGSVDAVIARERQKLRANLAGIVAAQEAKIENVIVLAESSESVAKKLERISERTPEAQLVIVRQILKGLEVRGRGFADSRFSNESGDLMSATINCDPQVRSEVRARLHSLACSAAVGSIVIQDPEKFNVDLENKRRREIGDFGLDGADLQKFLVDGFPGMSVVEVLGFMQTKAHSGSPYVDLPDISPVGNSRNPILDEVMAALNISEESAIESWRVASHFATASFLASEWKPVGSDFVNQAINFGKWTEAKKKGPEMIRGKIWTLGSGWLRDVKLSDGSYLFPRQFQYDPGKHILENRLAKAMSSGVFTEEDAEYFIESVSEWENAPFGRLRDMSRGVDTRLDLDLKNRPTLGSSISLDDSSSYNVFFERKLTKMLEGVNFITKPKIKPSEMNEKTYKDTLALAKDLDPDGSQLIEVLWFMGACQVHVWNNVGIWDEVDDAIKRAVSVRFKDENQRTRTFLPEVLPNGKKTVRFMHQIMENEKAQALENSADARRRGYVRTLKIG